MAQRVDSEIIRALKKRAWMHGKSAEGKHRTILAALARSRHRAFAEVLASMPDVGFDADFERVDSVERSTHVKGRR